MLIVKTINTKGAIPLLAVYNRTHKLRGSEKL